MEESGEDFAEEIDNVPAEEDEPSEAESKKRKACLASRYGSEIPFLPCIDDQRPVSKAGSTKPASKKAKPASSRVKKVKPTDEEEEED